MIFLLGNEDKFGDEKTCFSTIGKNCPVSLQLLLCWRCWRLIKDQSKVIPIFFYFSSLFSFVFWLLPSGCLLQLIICLHLTQLLVSPPFTPNTMSFSASTTNHLWSLPLPDSSMWRKHNGYNMKFIIKLQILTNANCSICVVKSEQQQQHQHRLSCS